MPPLRKLGYACTLSWRSVSVRQLYQTNTPVQRVLRLSSTDDLGGFFTAATADLLIDGTYGLSARSSVVPECKALLFRDVELSVRSLPGSVP